MSEKNNKVKNIILKKDGIEKEIHVMPGVGVDDSCKITTKTLEDGTKEFCLDCGDDERIELRYKGKDTEFFESMTTMAKMKSVIFKKKERPEE